jgi:hypothetical protein
VPRAAAKEDEGVTLIQFMPIGREPDAATAQKGLWLGRPAALERPEPNAAVTPWTVRSRWRHGLDGLNYPVQIVLGIPSSKIEVQNTKSNYQKLAQLSHKEPRP